MEKNSTKAGFWDFLIALMKYRVWVWTVSILLLLYLFINMAFVFEDGSCFEL